MVGVLSAYEALSTGNHEIRYVLILDEDDFESHAAARLLPFATVLIGKRDRTVNARFNEAVDQFPADVYIQACDDAYPLAFHWDAMMHGAQVLPAFSWQEKNDPQNATYLCISEKWRKAVGRFYPEYFPFWFADTWIAEVFLLAFAKPIPVVNQLQVGGKRGKTQGMRDVGFWFDFYAHTRTERMAEAERIAKASGFTLNCRRDRQEQIKQLEAADLWQKGRVELYEKSFGDTGEPSPIYLMCKQRAEQCRAA